CSPSTVRGVPSCSSVGRGRDYPVSRAWVCPPLSIRDDDEGMAPGRAGTARRRVSQMRQGLAALRATGTEIGLRVWCFAPLAEVYGKMGQVEEGLVLLAGALERGRKTGLRAGEAELWRLQGELLLQSGVLNPESRIQKEVEACFHRAIEIARRQLAKSLEL